MNAKPPIILIGIGANLPSEAYGPPLAACEAALGALEKRGVRITARSRWFESEPVPVSDQPWYINGVARVETDLDARGLLALLHEIEAQFGRVRTVANAPRVLDLDLLAYGDDVVEEHGFHVPHARMTDRAFVLLPLQDVAPDWVDPRTGRSVQDLIAELPADQVCRPHEGAPEKG